METDTQGFINYNRLEYKERLFFAHSGLDRFIKISSKILAKRIGRVETDSLDTPYFSEADSITINFLICDLLILIGKHSNDRFGPTPESQDNYFSRPSERNGFPSHLYISRWCEKKEQLLHKDKTKKDGEEKNEDKIKRNANSPGELYSKKAFNEIPDAKKVTFGQNMTETETRAVGVLYFTSLFWKTLQEQNNVKCSDDSKSVSIALILDSGFHLFSLLDKSDSMIAQSEAATGRNARAHEIIREVYGLDPDEENPKLITRVLNALKKESLNELSRKTIERALQQLRNQGRK
jgi:hypothetical protein